MNQITHKTAALVLILMMAASMLFSATMLTVTSSPTASAGWLEDMNCEFADEENRFYRSDSIRPLGYSTAKDNLVARAATGVAGGLVSNAILGASLVSKAQDTDGDTRMTLYEKYTFDSAQYAAWVGAYVGDDAVGDSSETFEFNSNGAYESATTAPNLPRAGSVPATAPIFASNWFECWGILQTASTAVINNFQAVNGIWITGAIEIYGFGIGASITDPDSPLYPLGQSIEGLIVGNSTSNGLRDAFYLPFLTPLIMIGACSLAYVGLIKRSSIAAAQGAAWMLCAAIAGLMFVNNPLAVPAAMDTVVTAVAEGATAAITPDANAEALCNATADTAGGSAEVRELKCVVWWNTILIPWVNGQFGMSYGDPDLRTNATSSSGPASFGVWLNTSSGAGMVNGQTSWAIYQFDRMNAGNWETLASVAYAMLGQEEPVGPSYKADTSRQFSMMMMSGISAIGVVLVLGIFGIMSLAYQLSTIMLLLLGPVFLLFGAAPGWGRRIAVRWAELLVSLTIKRVAILLMMVIYIAVYGFIMNTNGTSEDSVGWLLNTVIVSVLAFLVLAWRSKFVKVITGNISFGGERSYQDQSGRGSRLLGAVAMAGVGAAAGGVAGAAARKSGKAATAAGGQVAAATATRQASEAASAANRVRTAVPQTRVPGQGSLPVAPSPTPPLPTPSGPSNDYIAGASGAAPRPGTIPSSDYEAGARGAGPRPAVPPQSNDAYAAANGAGPRPAAPGPAAPYGGAPLPAPQGPLPQNAPPRPGETQESLDERTMRARHAEEAARAESAAAREQQAAALRKQQTIRNTTSGPGGLADRVRQAQRRADQDERNSGINAQNKSSGSSGPKSDKEVFRKPPPPPPAKK